MYVFLIFFRLQFSSHSYEYGNSWIYIFLLILLNTLFIPVLLFYLMRKFELIESLHMENRKDRFLPFLVTGIFYLTTGYVLNQAAVFQNLGHVFNFSAILVFIALITTFFWKISIHSMAMGAMSGFIIYFTRLHFFETPWLAYAALMASGFVGYARLRLDLHTPAQVYGGFLIGAATFVITLLWLLN